LMAQNWGSGRVQCLEILWGWHLAPMMGCQMEQHLELLLAGCLGCHWD
jgi:hypothetical protein